MSKKAVAVLGAIFLVAAFAVLAGYSLHKRSPHNTKPADTPPAALTLTVEPATASPGQTVTLTLRTTKPGMLNSIDPAAKDYITHACFAGCKTGLWAAVPLSPTAGDSTLYTGRFTIPLFLPDSAGSPLPLVTGKYELTLACLTGEQKGCPDRPEVSVAIQVTGQSTTAAWTSLPLGAPGTAPSTLPVLGGFSHTAVDPTDPQHSVTCVAGSPNQTELPDIPRLEVTRNGGKTKGRISLVNAPFQGQHGIVGCRTVALDPQHPDSFYAEDSGNTGGGSSMTQPPYVTTDHGETWEPVPMPTNLQGLPGPAFRGFSMAAGGVTAWFATASFDRPLVASEQVAGHLTTDGGHTWQKVPVPCNGANCLTQLSTGFLVGQNGLIRSADQGKHWDWVRYAGSPIAAFSFYALGENHQTLLAVNAAVAKQYVPLLYSADGGQNWRVVQLPSLPSGWMRDPASPVWDFPVLNLLPDGALLAHRGDAQSPEADWYQLRPGSAQWEIAAPPQTNRP